MPQRFVVHEFERLRTTAFDSLRNLYASPMLPTSHWWMPQAWRPYAWITGSSDLSPSVSSRRGQVAAAVELDGLGVAGPVGEQEVGGRALATEGAGNRLGSLQEGRRRVRALPM